MRKYYKDIYFDYREPKSLQRFIDSYGRIEPMGRTGLSAKQQRKLNIAVKRARHLGFLPFVTK